MQADRSEEHHVVVVGAGFGGLTCAQHLSHGKVKVTVLDRRNHHLFQPLLYQVATSSLSPSEIAWPIRNIFRRKPSVTTLLAEVEGVDKDQRQVVLDDGSRIGYDTLVLATGARHAYFGHPEWEPFAPGLKTIEDAVSLRDRFLCALEAAERETDPARREELMTFVVIGGGPTGVELAGALGEFSRSNIAQEFRALDLRQLKIVLIDAGTRVLATFDAALSAYAADALRKIGVTIELGNAVSGCTADSVTFGTRTLKAGMIIWAAGVHASPAAKWLDTPADRAGRALVAPDLTVPDHPEIFVIGDTASVNAFAGRPVPGVAPAAKQQGKFVAATILRRLGGDKSSKPFVYKHAGDLATIGGKRAVIDFGFLKMRGNLAWWLWGFAHIFFLTNTRDRINVAASWLWIFLRGERTARVISKDKPGAAG